MSRSTQAVLLTLSLSFILGPGYRDADAEQRSRDGGSLASSRRRAWAGGFSTMAW